MFRQPRNAANPISRVLYPPQGRAPIIYLRRRSPAASSNLPPDIGRATLDCRYTWSCNPRDVLPDDVAASAVGSYPAFSPLPGGQSRQAVVFCHVSSTVTRGFPLGSMALCVARTFLRRRYVCNPPATDHPAASKFLQIYEFLSENSALSRNFTIFAI